MNSLAIVALPAEDDYVHKISSEKVPHLTLLFLGEDASQVKNLKKIIDFVGHTSARSLTPFELQVDYRGELGDDSADVLFFSKNKWHGFQSVNTFRSYLLKDDNIRKAYDSTEQFSEWLPHLTLGFPATPAKEDKRDFSGISYVRFDRIAVWFSDSEGVEFRLKNPEWDWDMDMSTPMAMMGSISKDVEKQIEEHLEHFGIKGMRWGKRSSDTGAPSKRDIRRGSEDARTKLRVGETKKDFRDAAKDAVWVRKTHGANLNIGRLHGKTTEKIIKDASKSMKPEMKALKKRPEFSSKDAKKAIRKNKNIYQPADPIAAQYHKAVSEIYMKNLKAASGKHMQISPSGKWKDTFKEGKNYWYIGFERTDGAKHAEVSNPDVAVLVRPIFDEEGYIIDFEDLMSDDSMSQSDLFVDEFLSHYGIKGMKWGRRSSGQTAVTVADKRKKLKTSGGHGHPGHPDAIAARTSGQIAKKSGIKALSNAQLKEYNNRLNLEQQAKRLTFEEKNAGRKFVSKLIGKGVTSRVESGSKSLTGEVVRKKMAIGAAALALA